MKKLFRHRLAEIRGLIDNYIEEKGEHKASIMPKPANHSEIHNCKEGATITKFLNILRISVDEEYEDSDNDDEQEAEMLVCCKESIEDVLDAKTETFSAMLLRLIDEKGLKDSEVYKNANIDRRLFSKIRGDEDYVPSKKTAISFCFAMKLNINETKKLLETAGYALSTASRFDLIIMFLIENKEYNVHFANIVLDDYGEGTLSK